MGLDINIKVQKPVVCPKCGEVVTHTFVDCENSSGRVWSELLEKIGYKNDRWYATDMKLSEEQSKELFDFVTQHDVYNRHSIRSMVSIAILEKNEVVVNADW